MKTADNMQHRQKTGIPAVSITLDRRDAVICLYERLVTEPRVLPSGWLPCRQEQAQRPVPLLEPVSGWQPGVLSPAPVQRRSAAVPWAAASAPVSP